MRWRARDHSMPDQQANPRMNPTPSLTERQRQILHLVVGGFTSREIAAKLSLSIKTVEEHRARIRDKLGAGSRASLIRRAVELGFVK
jgi:two-component system response regulator NreC